MKLLITTILLFTSLGFSKPTKSNDIKSIKQKNSRKISNANITANEYSMLMFGFGGLDKSNIDKNFKSSFEGIEKFSDMKVLSENDLPLVVLVLKALVLMDPLDPSRTAPQMLTESFHANNLIYKKAFKQLSTEDQKIMSDIITVFGSPNKKGNG